MTNRKVILGGAEGSFFEYEDEKKRGANIRRGIFATHPAATPKANDIAFSEGGEESLCRLYVYIQDPFEYERFMEVVEANYGSEALKFAKVLAATSGRGGTGYIDFFAASVQPNYNEKVQVIPVLSDHAVVYGFGQFPPTVNVAGQLLNTEQDDQLIAFNIIYQSILRATRLAESKAICYFFMPDRIYGGCITSMNEAEVADTSTIANFGFSMLVSRMSLRHNPDRYPTIVQSDPFEQFGFHEEQRIFMLTGKRSESATFSTDEDL